MTSLASRLAPYRATLGNRDPWDPARRWPLAQAPKPREVFIDLTLLSPPADRLIATNPSDGTHQADAASGGETFFESIGVLLGREW